MPPGSLLTDCAAPKFAGKTNEDLVKFVASYREALNNCNADKRSLREWSGMYQAKTENGNVNN